MIGVNVDNIDKLIDFINEFNDCYSESCLKYPFNELEKDKKIAMILKVIDNYSTILYSVNCSYQS